jgi:hypothetical protein
MVQSLSLSVLCFIFLTLFSTAESSAQNIQWNQPEVVAEKLARDNRRVLHFSGTAKAGTQLRVRENKVKMIFNAKKIRWARIPQKHRVQFPVIASDTGYFSFRLYLPTVAVEIPLEIFRGGKWVPYRFSFEVPDTGSADDFKFVEESFKIRKDEDGAKIEDFLSEYDSDEDRGMIVNDRSEWKSWVTGKVIVWGSLGFTYSTLEQEISASSTDDLGSFGGLDFPYWELGGEYRWNEHWKVDLAFMNRPGNAEADGAYTLQNEDMNWTELRANLSYFPLTWESEKYRLGFKGGIQRHDLPIVKRTGFGVYRVFSNDVLFVAAGVGFETMKAKEWNFDASAQLIYPVSVGGEFNESAMYGFNMNIAMFKELIPALSLGGKVDFSWLTFEAQYPDTSGPALPDAVADVTLWQITPSFLLKAEF